MVDSDWVKDEGAFFIPFIGFVIAMIPILALDYSILAFGMSLVTILLGVVAILVYLYVTRHAPSADETDDPLTALQVEFAEGNISKDEFDNRVEKLLETQERAENTAGIETEDLEFE